MSSNREYAIALSRDDWNKIDHEMFRNYGDKWANFREEAEKVEDDGVALRWDDFSYNDMTSNLELLVDALDNVTKYDIGDDPLEYGIVRQEHYGARGLLDAERPMAILEYKELHLPEAERIIRAMAKELPKEKVMEIFKSECNSRAYGIEPVINNYLG